MRVFLLALVLVLALASTAARAQDAQRYAVVPQPQHLEARTGTFVLTPTTAVVASPEAVPMGEAWAQRIRQASLLPMPVHAGTDARDGAIAFLLDADADLGDEGYAVDVTPTRAVVRAKTTAGLFYGAQTLRQMLPPAVERGGIDPGGTDFVWDLPAVAITDAPRFSYRGLHLDVSRHFASVDFVKRYLDLMALYKFNRFHWHLTDDQGWRIEIKGYPRLTTVGAWRDSTLIGHYRNQPHAYDDVRHGGFYTQDEIRDVVAYAAERHITVIPEIEMPGHATAALAAYPEFACTAGPFTVESKWGVFEDIFCPKEETFAFLETVLTQVIDLFPGEYVHIGGDEAPKTRWAESPLAQEVIQREGLGVREAVPGDTPVQREQHANEKALQSYFVRRIERFLNQHGRRVIGWDEIVEGGLSPTATLMFWRDWNKEALALAAAQGNDLIMTPNSTLYFDHFQGDPASEPLAIGGMTTLEDVYAYEPVPESYSDEEAKHVLGAQANLWREYIKTDDKVEYMVYPRALALAEVVWSPKGSRDWADFQRRLPMQLRRLNVMQVHYRPPFD